MATEKALFTKDTDFRNVGFPDFPINPYLYHNGSKWVIDGNGGESFEYSNEPFIVDGVRGNATEMIGNYGIFKHVGMPASNKYMLSFWVKPKQEDLETSWTMLATNRGGLSAGGYAYSNQGFHVAIYNQDSVGGVGTLNVRLYGSASVNMYSSQGVYGRGDFNFEPNVWYHISVIYDPDADFIVKAYVDGDDVLFTSSDPDPTAGWSNSLTLGDMLDTSNSSQYKFQGYFDDLIVSYGSDVWSASGVQQYYDIVANGRYLDYETIGGELRLGKTLSGDYTATKQIWQPDVIDLGENGLTDYGKIQIVSEIAEGTSINVEYRLSDSSSSFSESWKPITSGGIINETNKRYLQVRAILESNYVGNTPILEEIQILDFEEAKRINLAGKPLQLYFDMEEGLISAGTLNWAYDVIIEEKINEEDILEFKLPHNDKKLKEIGEDPVEMRVIIGNRNYVVKELKKVRGERGAIHVLFTCEALWTELGDWYVQGLDETAVNALTAVKAIVDNVVREEGDPEFDWTIGRIETDGRKRSISAEWKNVLELMQEVQDTWGGELKFDTDTKTINLVKRLGKDTGIRFYHKKNVKEIERHIDTYDLKTRIYPVGKGELDITTVNDGVPYIENFEWVEKLGLRKKVIPYRFKDDRYTIPENLKEDAEAILNDRAKPKISYVADIQDLSVLSGHEHEAFELGDSLAIVDKELMEDDLPQRVVRRNWDVHKPENSTVELSEPQKTLQDIESRAVDDDSQDLEESDPLSQTDAQQMTVFNQLLNSRADEGISADWVQVGTDFDIANAGFSGDWSFVVTPKFDKTASLTQEVQGVAHRSAYTVSAAVATEGDITRGGSEDAFVGIKVNVYYEDSPKNLKRITWLYLT
ncbi:phage tail spike protein [Marinococcus halophilus]|uniref:phage tail spike protein n=1 Tax=Marinococcus halophilus TaxID=1371 RepID=UPI00361FCAA6